MKLSGERAIWLTDEGARPVSKIDMTFSCGEVTSRVAMLATSDG